MELQAKLELKIRKDELRQIEEAHDELEVSDLKASDESEQQRRSILEVSDEKASESKRRW